MAALPSNTGAAQPRAVDRTSRACRARHPAVGTTHRVPRRPGVQAVAEARTRPDVRPQLRFTAAAASQFRGSAALARCAASRRGRPEGRSDSLLSWGVRQLGHEKESLPVLADDAGGGCQIDFGLAAAGYTLQQGLQSRGPRQGRVDRLALGVIEPDTVRAALRFLCGDASVRRRSRPPGFAPSGGTSCAKH